MTTPSHSFSLKTCPPILGGAAFAVGLGLHYALGRPLLLPLPYPFPVFAVVGSLALAFALWAFFCFRAMRTPWEPHTTPCVLVTGGPFCFSRNPAYLGALIIMVAVAWWTRGALVFSTPILFFIVMNWFLIPWEERKMNAIFGKDYRCYSRSVRRWL